ncbi:biotin/lipoyl-binding protein [Coprothermobacteraceae bacterium]|nr:biotin/lipoyl-binding protein [Coprothermobacteraceae bacterium]
MSQVFRYVVKVNGKEYNVEIESEGEEITVRNIAPAARTTVQRPSASPQQAPVAPTAAPEPVNNAPTSAGGHVVEAPLPGKILRIAVSVGSPVKKGDLLLILEAMKMENEILAPMDGTVQQVLVNPNQTVNTHDPLVVIG